jgi:hypothetical protein
MAYISLVATLYVIIRQKKVCFEMPKVMNIILMSTDCLEECIWWPTTGHDIHITSEEIKFTSMIGSAQCHRVRTAESQGSGLIRILWLVVD